MYLLVALSCSAISISASILVLRIYHMSDIKSPPTLLLRICCIKALGVASGDDGDGRRIDQDGATSQEDQVDVITAPTHMANVITTHKHGCASVGRIKK